MLSSRSSLLTLVSLFLVLSPPVRAQYGGGGYPGESGYSGPAYSGGSSFYYNMPHPYGPLGNADWGIRYNLVSSVTCDGEITTTFTWNPGSSGEPPPKSVIVREECTLAVGGTARGNDPAADASSANGLGDPPQVTSSSDPGPPPSVSKSAPCSGIHYRVMTPAADGSIVLHCTPSASASASIAPGSPVGSIAYAGASVTYKANIYPLYILRNGQRLIAPNNKALPGQSNVFTVECGGLTQSNHQWSASGDKFSSWKVTPPDPNTGEKGSARKHVNIFYNNLELYFYYIQGGYGGSAETVNCALTVGDAPNQVNVTVDGEVKVYQPTSDWHPVWGGIIDFLPNAQNPTSVGLYGTTGNFGINFPATVTVPENLDNSATFGFAQIVTDKAWALVGASNGQTAELVGEYNGITGLDAVFPYDAEHAADSQPHGGGDSPYLGLNSDFLHVTTGFSQASEPEQFSLYLMFKPSGGEWVPLKMCLWNWKVDAIYGNPWQLTSSCTITNPIETSQHPEWNAVNPSPSNWKIK